MTTEKTSPRNFGQPFSVIFQPTLPPNETDMLIAIKLSLHCYINSHCVTVFPPIEYVFENLVEY